MERLKQLQARAAEVEEVGRPDSFRTAVEHAGMDDTLCPPSINVEDFLVPHPSSHDTFAFDTTTSYDWQLAPPWTSSLPLRTPSVPAKGTLSILSAGDIESLITKYFEQIHPCYPFLDREWFLDRLFLGESETQDLFGTMVLAICALTMAFISDVIRSDQSHAFKIRREKVMADVISRHYTRALGVHTTLEQVITTFLLGLYFSIIFDDSAGHFRIAEAAHLARSMGLHRASTYERMDAEEQIRTMAVYCFVVVRNR